MDFIHLHVHSQYSFLDGASSLDSLLEKAKNLNMSAMALTDHNRLTGAVRFYEKAKVLGIKPIIGVEINIEGDFHLTLLSKDEQGYSNLCRLLTEAQLGNRSKKPAATREMLGRFNTGLVALSGCSKGEIPSLVSQGKINEAKESSQFYKEIFGEDFFIELIRYPSREGMSKSHRLASFAMEEGIPVVATNNVHYTKAEDYRIKELLNAIGQNIPVSRLQGYRTVEQYLKSPKEMTSLFRDIPEAIRMTKEIADKCNLELDIGKLHFPRSNVPEGESDYSYLVKLARAGALRKYGKLTIRTQERLVQELDTIRKLGFCGYFLVVWDIVRLAKERGIRCQARGSAVDSLVVYVLDISTVDPIEHDLLFERFMHPLRHEPPDIDLDIDRKRRDEVRDYVYQKYGAEECCLCGDNQYLYGEGSHPGRWQSP